ncbi:MAG: histidine kinase [Psychroflexus sp.]|nr:histidine kinase [Psychroflexus sp.]
MIMEFYPVHFLWHITTATLFLTALFSFIIGVRTRLKTFFWYFIFSFFLLVYIQFQSFYFDLLASDTQSGQVATTILHWFVQVIYNSAYCFFFLHLLDVKTYLPRFARLLKISVISLFLLSALIGITSFLLKDERLFVQYFHFGFTPVISFIGLLVLIKIWQIPGKLKIFFFIGGLSYMTFSLIALILSKLYDYQVDDLSGFVPMVYFYTGVIIEQICFGFALAYFIEQINKDYQLSLNRNLDLKIEHNQELSKQLSNQSKRLKKMAQDAKEKQLALVKSEYEAKLHESRLSSLQSKMNPHFIFNALNSIKAYLIDNDKRKAVNYMNRFSRLVRKILESSRIEKISLDEELEIIELYVKIENTRFNDAIDFSLEKQIDHKNIFVPPLILQPFIENALWHGLAPSKTRKQLMVNVTEKGGIAMVEIIDNGVGRQYSEKAKANNKIKKKSMGLQMTKERLKVFNEKFNTDYHFEFSDLNQNGTKVSIYLNTSKETLATF